MSQTLFNIIIAVAVICNSVSLIILNLRKNKGNKNA